MSLAKCQECATELPPEKRRGLCSECLNERAQDKIEDARRRERRMFAAMAMQGLCANSIPGNHHQHKWLAADAVNYADTLITELDRTEGGES